MARPRPPHTRQRQDPGRQEVLQCALGPLVKSATPCTIRTQSGLRKGLFVCICELAVGIAILASLKGPKACRGALALPHATDPTDRTAPINPAELADRAQADPRQCPENQVIALFLSDCTPKGD